MKSVLEARHFHDEAAAFAYVEKRSGPTVSEAKERVRAALVASGLALPARERQACLGSGGGRWS
jgi:predicted ATPase with chaperone activity